MKKLIKVYGERNTNTTYLSRLLTLNLHAAEVPGGVPPNIMKMQQMLPGNELVRDIYFHLTFGRNLGWKHSRVKPQEELKKYRLANANLVFLTITKNPYSWLLSLYRRPYHQYYTKKPDFERFLQSQWKTILRDNVKETSITPVSLWNIKNRSYLHLDPKRTMNLTSEGIFEDPAMIIQQISERYAIGRKSEKFINYDRSTKEKGKDSTYYRDYYLSEKWRENLSGEAIAIINESIDKDLMAHFGYTVLS